METRKVLGQGMPLAAALTDIYAVPASTEAVVSSITICNQGTNPTAFRVSLAVAAGTDTPSQYIYYNKALNGTDTYESKLGIGLGPGDVVRGYSQNGNCSISVFGVEIA